jgi:hypothetical protein
MRSAETEIRKKMQGNKDGFREKILSSQNDIEMMKISVGSRNLRADDGAITVPSPGIWWDLQNISAVSCSFNMIWNEQILD